MAAELKEATGTEAVLIAGRGGVFDVIVDGKLIYSKAKTGRFPNSGEVAEKLK